MTLAKLFREPLIQFLVLGACIYVAYGLFGEGEELDQEYVITIDAARIDGFVSGWQSRMRRAPTPQELDGMIDQYLKEEILYREAKAMGLGQDDPITRRRMAQKLEFLTKDIARLKEPAGGELEAYFSANQGSYRQPDLITFTQVFFDPDKRDSATLTDAEAALKILQARGEPDGNVGDVGDRFMLQSYYPQKSELDIRRQLGSGFSAEVMQLAPGQWYGPVLSGYGVHLVYVHDLQQAPEPVYANVQEQVYEDWQAEQQENFNAEYFTSLRNRYQIIIDVDGGEDAAVIAVEEAAEESEGEPAS